VLPYPDEDEEEELNGHPPQPDPEEQRRLAAKSTMEDFTQTDRATFPRRCSVSCGDGAPSIRDLGHVPRARGRSLSS